jgi:hypothetical protein
LEIEKMVLDTCTNILEFNEKFREGLITQLKEFISSPEKRTADVVASIEVMLIQIYCLTQVKNSERFLGGDFKLDQDSLNLLYRFAFEELLRRGLKSDTTPLNKE